ncbi:oligosaccharide flippase family protein [Arthrobacter sp. Cr_A7]|uniref:lipopolysaccharide biosynthesis protein n=1 Tax=Arthrobacter sp. Cr_A7 TaxID=3031017 RepID=UPI0023DA1D81|nr:oligosaccharide flippase family protein [Arthrobacter sp. Cr_A7]MDF2048842.1 oligosaccharide flippase family protein [Arthrobacter sp. Cr_A7]
MKNLAKRLVGFSTLPLISALTPLLLLPIVARLGGAEGWASVAIGQAIGAFASVAIGYGSAIWGPAAIASANDESKQRGIYTEVVSSKALLSCFVFPLAIVATMFLVSHRYLFEAIGMALSMALVGWSPAWYMIGLGKAGPIATFETVPKLIATAFSAFLLLTTGVIWLYPLCLILASVIGLLLFHRSVLGVAWPKVSPLSKQSVALLRKRFSTALIDGVGTGYIAAPIPVVSMSSSVQAVSSVASGDKIYRYGLFAVVAMGNALQAWVLEPGARRVRRHVFAIAAHATLGLCGLLFLHLAGPLATEVMFGPEVAAGNPMLMFYGIAFFAVSTSTPLVRNLLIPAGRTRMVLAATILGAVVGLPLMVALNMSWGPEGVALGLAASELLVLCVTALAASPLLIRLKRFPAADLTDAVKSRGAEDRSRARGRRRMTTTKTLETTTGTKELD